MGVPAFVAKRFLLGKAGDMINSDHITRVYVSSGKLMADMTTGPSIELASKITAPIPTEHDGVTVADYVLVDL